MSITDIKYNLVCMFDIIYFAIYLLFPLYSDELLQTFEKRVSKCFKNLPFIIKKTTENNQNKKVKISRYIKK